MNNSKLWIVGKITNVLNDGWDFIGVFSDESLALSAINKVCFELSDKEKNKYFIAPAQLDEAFICANGTEWKNGHFPFE
tara:strand:+ start:6633 stop:6869 length:237 start_codon:yes stop_codon:yes gene_type:complete